jgi:hypothetical protein
MSVLRGSILTGTAALAVLVGVSLLSSAPALAAAPETPVTEAPTANTTGTTATFNGELSHGTLLPEKVTYYFAYSAGVGATCTESGMRAPGEPFPEAEDNEKVSAPVMGLEGSTAYAVCLIAGNPEGETTGTPQTFKTPTTKPVIPSETAPSVTPAGATLEAKINTEKQETSYRLEYASEAAKLGTPEATVLIEGSFPGVSAEQTAGPVETGAVLIPDTTYYYRVVATNGTGTENGKVESFTTLTLEKPLIEGPVSTSAFGQTTASLTGTVNPEYQVTTACEFQYATKEAALAGTPPSAPCKEPSASELGQVGYGLPVGASLTGLLPNTTYYYRLFVGNAKGPGGGAPEHFLTLPNPPTATTGGTTSIAPNSATIEGTVNPGAEGHSEQDKTTYYFQYGHTTGYGEQTPAGEAGEGESAVTETAGLTGLEPDTTYHYRIVASNDNTNSAGGVPQLVHGAGNTFTTAATPPLLGPPAAGAITQSAATITATIDAGGLPASYELQYGSTPGGLELRVAGNAPGPGTQTLTLSLGSLAPGTVYYYKLVVTGRDGTVETPEASFTTAAAPAASFTELTTTPLLNFPKEEAEPPKKTTNAEKLQKALKACGKKRSKSRRATCVRHARKEFGRSKK